MFDLSIAKNAIHGVAGMLSKMNQIEEKKSDDDCSDFPYFDEFCDACDLEENIKDDSISAADLSIVLHGLFYFDKESVEYEVCLHLWEQNKHKASMSEHLYNDISKLHH